MAPAALALAGALIFTLPAMPAWANPELQAASDTLRDSIAEWRREDAAYRAARAQGRISARESDEYAQFVATLRLRVLEQCEAVRRLGGETAVAPFDCVRMGNAEARPRVVVPPSAVLTREEKQAAMQARLSALEGEIDEALLKRQEELRQTAAGTNPGGDGGTTGGAEGTRAAKGGAQPGQSGRPGQDKPGGQAGQPGWAPVGGGDSASDGAAGSGAPPPSDGRTGGGSSPDPQGAPRQTAGDGGSGDDVVARQLREAAERETDPVLKEKLWDEYRKYREAKR